MDNSASSLGFNPSMSERVQLLLSDRIFGTTLVPKGKVWNYGIGLTQLWSSNLPFSKTLDTLSFWAKDHPPAAFLTVSYLVSWRLSISDDECLSQFTKIEQGVSSPIPGIEDHCHWVASSHWMTPNHQQAKARCSHSHLLQHGVNQQPTHLYAHYVDRLEILPATTCYAVAHPAFFSVILHRH